MRHVIAYIGARGHVAMESDGTRMQCVPARRRGWWGGSRDRGRSTVREQRDHRPLALTRASQARGHHLSVSRARPVWLTWSWEFPKTRSIILSLTFLTVPGML